MRKREDRWEWERGAARGGKREAGGVIPIWDLPERDVGGEWSKVISPVRGMKHSAYLMNC